jgi:hypothetical protein
MHADIPTTLLLRARSEFVEMPGLSLTTRQASRLWGLEHAMAARVLESLEEAGFLFRTDDGVFVRRTFR